MISVNGEVVKYGHFPDGTLSMLECPSNLLSGDYEIIWFFENVEEQVVLYNLVKHLRSFAVDQGAMVLCLPYVPNARMDRVHNPTEVFTLKYFADFINDLNFDRVLVLDPHSDVTPALINRCVIGYVKDAVNVAMQEQQTQVLCFPDAGAFKRYHDEFPYAASVYCDKVRDWKSGKLKGMRLAGDPEMVKDKRVMIVDDICSRGGTFILAANALLEAGASEVCLFVTHCENSIFAGAVLTKGSPIKHVYTTNSLHHAEHDKLTTYEITMED